jgi:hypothetical protein
MERDPWREREPEQGGAIESAPPHSSGSPGKQTLTAHLGGGGPSVDSVASAMLSRLGLGPVQRKQAERESTAPADDGPAPDDRLFLVAHEPAPGEITPIQMRARVDDAPGAAQAQPASDGAGQRMPEAVQAKMERSFGVDFSAVRVHEGPQASSIGAAAYTQGTDIHFAEGEYSPHSHSGQALLGHELAHVVQQSQGRVQAPIQAKGGAGVNTDPGLEAEADRQGGRAADGMPSGDGAAGPGAALQTLVAAYNAHVHIHGGGAGAPTSPPIGGISSEDPALSEVAMLLGTHIHIAGGPGPTSPPVPPCSTSSDDPAVRAFVNVINMHTHVSVGSGPTTPPIPPHDAGT